eukprot:3510658-Rhodomonas_salina.1
MLLAPRHQNTAQSGVYGLPVFLKRVIQRPKCGGMRLKFAFVRCVHNGPLDLHVVQRVLERRVVEGGEGAEEERRRIGEERSSSGRKVGGRPVVFVMARKVIVVRVFWDEVGPLRVSCVADGKRLGRDRTEREVVVCEMEVLRAGRGEVEAVARRSREVLRGEGKRRHG